MNLHFLKNLPWDTQQNPISPAQNEMCFAQIHELEAKTPMENMEFHCRSAFWLLSEGHQWSHKNHSGSLSVRLSGSGGIGLLFCKEVPWQIIPTNQYILRSQTFKKSRSGPFFRNEKGHQLWPNVSYIIIYIYIHTNFSYYIDEPWWTSYFGNPMGRYDSKPPNYTDHRTEVGITAQRLEIFCHAARREVHQGSFFWTGLAFVAIFLVVANEALPVGLKWFPGCLLRAIVKIGLYIWFID